MTDSIWLAPVAWAECDGSIAGSGQSFPFRTEDTMGDFIGIITHFSYVSQNRDYDNVTVRTSDGLFDCYRFQVTETSPPECGEPSDTVRNGP